MFGEKDKCCCQPPVSQTLIHMEYTQKIYRLEAELYEARRTIQDLAETNKHLSRAINRKE